MKLVCTFILLFFILTGCSSTVDFHGSTNVFTGPEVVGKTFGVNAQVGVGNSSKFVLSTLEQKAILSSQIIVNNNSGIIKDNNLNSHIGLGIAESFELYYRMLGDSPDPFGLKWQLVGGGANKKEAGIKALVFAGIAPTYRNDNQLGAINGNGTTRSYQSTLKVGMTEFGASIGYRLSPLIVVYTTPFYRHYNADAVLTSTSYPTVLIDKNAIVRGVALGVIINFLPATVFNLESGYAHSQYSSSVERDDYSLGVSLGFNIF